MWASIMHNQAKSGAPVWPFILFVTSMIMLLHLISSMMVMPIQITEPNVFAPHYNLTHQFNLSNQATQTSARVELPQSWVTALKRSQRQVLYELRTLKPHMELRSLNGPSIANLIVSSWKSGSTFLSEFFDSHPASFYFDEPLNYAEVHRFSNPDDEALHTALAMMTHFFKCDFTYAARHWPNFPYKYVYPVNSRLGKLCNNGLYKTNHMCSDPVFLSSMCSFHPIQLSKTVRLALNFTRKLLQRNEGLQILYLVRDPRAVIESRKNQVFCFADSCIEPQNFCKDLENDYFSFLELKDLFPGRIKVLRYEDVILQQSSVLRDVAHFFRLEIQQPMLDYLFDHTNGNRVQKHGQKEWNTYRNPFEALTQWKRSMLFDAVLDIQQECGEAMKFWGYKEASDQFDLLHFNPVLPLPEVLQ